MITYKEIRKSNGLLFFITLVAILLMSFGLANSYETCGNGWACPTPDEGGYAGWHGYPYHLGTDFKCPVDTDVVAIDDGVIKKSSSTLGYYGSACGATGGALLVEHKGIDSSGNTRTFYALYGHDYIESNLSVDSIVKKGQVLAKIHNYYGKDNNEECTTNWSHLHFGIHPDSIDSENPYRGVGTAGNDYGWVDPLVFLENYTPYCNLSVYGFSTKPSPVCASDKIDNFYANFYVKNQCTAEKTVDKMAIAIHKNGTPYKDCWLKESAEIISGNSTYSTGRHECKISEPGEYNVVAKLYMDGGWKDMDSKSLTVLDASQCQISQNSIPSIISLLLEDNKPANPKEGLVSFYPFNGNYNDESGNENHGHAGSSPPVLIADRFNNSNSAFWFDGVDDYIEVSNSISLNPNAYISLVAWVKADYASDDVSIFSNTIYLRSGYELWQHARDGKLIYAFRAYDSPYNSGLTGQKLYEINKWHMICATYNKPTGEIKIYIDGELDISNTGFSGGLIPATNPLWIGGWASSPTTRHFKGSIDDIRIYNRILNDYEIQTLYNSN